MHSTQKPPGLASEVLGTPQKILCFLDGPFQTFPDYPAFGDHPWKSMAYFTHMKAPQSRPGLHCMALVAPKKMFRNIWNILESNLEEWHIDFHLMGYQQKSHFF